MAPKYPRQALDPRKAVIAYRQLLPYTAPMKERSQAQVLRELLDAARLSQRAAARELSIAERTMRYYVSGTTPIPRAVMLALEYLAGADGFHQKLAADIRKEAGCTCGEFEINTYAATSPGPRSLAGFSVGNCKMCADGTTEEVAYRTLKAKKIPFLPPKGRQSNRSTT